VKFDDFIEQGKVRRAFKDISLAKSLIETAGSDLSFLQKLEINRNSARKIMSNYYDILRSILEAIALLDGFKVYSHEAFAFFLQEKNENIISIKFDRFRKIRNDINYYGKNISVEEVKEYSIEILNIIKGLRKKYLGEVK
jgi:hypothetical protein